MTVPVKFFFLPSPSPYKMYSILSVKSHRPRLKTVCVNITGVVVVLVRCFYPIEKLLRIFVLTKQSYEIFIKTKTL